MEDQRHGSTPRRNSEILQNRLMTNTELLAATRYYKKEQGVTKTCQTCKQWSNNAKKKPKFVYTSMGKCKEIFKKLTTFDSEIENHVPFFHRYSGQFLS
jgi:hypothetical protein